MASREWLQHITSERDARPQEGRDWAAAPVTVGRTSWGTGAPAFAPLPDPAGRSRSVGPSPPIEHGSPHRGADGDAFSGGEEHADDNHELADALESLRVARAEHHRLAGEVARAKRGFDQPPRRVDARGTVRSGFVSAGPAGATSSHSGTSEVHRLKSHIHDLATLLERGEAAAKQTTARVSRHVAAVKAEVQVVMREVAKLQASVDVAEDRCAAAEQEVRELRQRLRETLADRDDASARLSKLLTDTRQAVRVLEADMERKDRELGRLREQNDFLNLQLIQRRG